MRGSGWRGDDLAVCDAANSGWGWGTRAVACDGTYAKRAPFRRRDNTKAREWVACHGHGKRSRP